MTKLSGRWTIAAAAWILGGCATFSDDGGLGVARQVAGEKIGKEVRWIKTEEDAEFVRSRVATLRAAPLTADAAVQIALLNNRGLQASFAELLIAEADYVQAGRLPNPTFSFARLMRTGALTEIERSIAIDVLGVLTMPFDMRIEAERFKRAQYSVAGEVLGLAADTRRAYYNAVAAQEILRYTEQAKMAADASADLAERMRRAGNFNRLTEARERVFYAQVATQLARARTATMVAREKLIRLMGLWGEELQFTVPDRLPDPPTQPRELQNIEATALNQRLDILAARKDAEAVAAALGLTRVTRFVNVLHAGYLWNRVSEASDEPGAEPQQTGFEIEIALPIFDWGGARTAKAEALYMQAVNRVSDIAINARSEIREAYGGYRAAHEIAKHYREEIVPLRKAISEQQLLEYNGMLIGVFELLADARDQIASVTGAIEALRDFWLADADLDTALTAGSPGSAAGGMTTATLPGGSAGGGH